MKTIYFVRHGQTQFNLENRLQGWNDSPLSSRGEAQVQKVAQSLAPLGIQRAWVSPLGRARQTASIIQDALCIEIEPVDELREVSFGAFEGNTLDELRKKFPGQWEKRQADKWNYRPPEGEANKDAVPRAQNVVSRIENWPPSDPLLIVAHFAINRIVLSLLAGLTPDETVEMNVAHCTIYRATQQNSHWTLSYKDAESPYDDFQEGWLRQ
ncbi:MAG: histidine phosphatase family protein [Candidatus Omnitrophica bacterium]|nr:histidine phosphatase family protein [Candidatus Omnitrophota bacterium]